MSPRYTVESRLSQSIPTYILAFDVVVGIYILFITILCVFTVAEQ